jgi:hypothetical protein
MVGVVGIVYSDRWVVVVIGGDVVLLFGGHCSSSLSFGVLAVVFVSVVVISNSAFFELQSILYF